MSNPVFCEKYFNISSAQKFTYCALSAIDVIRKTRMAMKLHATPIPSVTQSSLRKHAYSNIQKILPPKNENFQKEKSDIFNISAQNIDCGYSLEPPRRGGSIEYPQSMFLSRNKKNNVYPCQPQFYYIKVGFKGVKII